MIDRTAQALAWVCSRKKETGDANHRFFVGMFAATYSADGMRTITLISKSNPASQLTPKAVQAG